jgi:hypothetical protein
MAIQTKRDKLLVMQMIFQARYAEGYRLLDRKGDVLNFMSAEMPEWRIGPVATQLLRFRHSSLPISANIGTGALDLAWDKQQTSGDSEKNCAAFARACHQFYTLVTSQLDLSRTTRVGVRYLVVAPAENAEETDRVACRAVRSPFQEYLCSTFGMELVDGATNLFLEDTETGQRRMVNIHSVFIDFPPGAPEPMGFRSEPSQGKGGLQLDVDTYLRPTSGRMEKVDVWIQEQLLKVLQLAPSLLLWPIQH